MESYIKKNLSNKVVNKDAVDKLILASNYKILELSVLCRLVEHGEDFECVCDAQLFVSKYLLFLKRAYSSAEYHSLVEVLLIIAILGDRLPLYLSEIGCISGENGVTLRLIGMLRDILPLMNVERDFDGNTYSFSNSDVALQIVEQIPADEKIDLIRGMVKLATATMREAHTSDFMCAEVVLCSVVTELSMMLPGGTKEIGDDRFDLFSSYVDTISKQIDFKNCEYANMKRIALFFKIRYQYCLLYKEELSGDDDQTLDVLVDYAIDYAEHLLHYSSQDTRGTAELLFEVYEKRRIALGDDSVETLEILEDYARVLLFNNCDDKREAEEKYRTLYKKYVELYGKNHYKTYECMYYIAYCRFFEKDYEVVIDLIQEIYNNSVIAVEKNNEIEMLNTAKNIVSQKFGGGEYCLDSKEDAALLCINFMTLVHSGEYSCLFDEFFV